MRTTLDIDEDVLEIVKDIARSQRRSTGAVMSELARKALRGSPSTRQSNEFVMKDGWVVLADCGGILTKDDVDRLSTELEQEELDRAVAIGRERPAGTDDREPQSS